METLIGLAFLVYFIGAIIVFFWIGNKHVESSEGKPGGFLGAFITAIPWALIWPIALVFLFAMAEKRKK